MSPRSKTAVAGARTDWFAIIALTSFMMAGRWCPVVRKRSPVVRQPSETSTATSSFE
jgi:hypothetical protein